MLESPEVEQQHLCILTDLPVTGKAKHSFAQRALTPTRLKCFLCKPLLVTDLLYPHAAPFFTGDTLRLFSFRARRLKYFLCFLTSSLGSACHVGTSLVSLRDKNSFCAPPQSFC